MQNPFVYSRNKFYRRVPASSRCYTVFAVARIVRVSWRYLLGEKLWVQRALVLAGGVLREFGSWAER